LVLQSDISRIPTIFPVPKSWDCQMLSVGNGNPGSGIPAFRNPGIGKQARYCNPIYTYSECGFIVSGLHSTNIEITCGEYIEILYGYYIIPCESYVRPKWVNDLSPICDLYLGSIFPTHISHQPHIGNTYPPCIEFLYGMNFSCLVGSCSRGPHRLRLPY
jgi:hypothetical protein